MAKTKLRKMLGSAEHPTIRALMDLISTQSRDTLSRWALEYVHAHYLPILIRKNRMDPRLAQAGEIAEKLLCKKLSLKEAKPFLQGASAAAREMEGDAAAQAAAKAISTAYGVTQTPTNALGFTFYGAAAFAYDTAGEEGNKELYDALADEELEKIFNSLHLAAVPDEKNPVKMDWHC